MNNTYSHSHKFDYPGEFEVMKAMSATQEQPLSEQTVEAMQQFINQALNSVTGIEKTVVDGALRVLYPRIEERIREMSEEDLRRELKTLYNQLGSILHEASKVQARTRRQSHRRGPKRNIKAPNSNKTHEKRRIRNKS